MNIQPSIDLKKVNLQTAVGYLVSLHENEYQWNLLGIKVVGHIDALPIPEGTYEYGDAYMVGTETPYDMYVYSRPDGSVNTEGYWFPIGKFPMPGPQGPKGNGLEQITRESSNTVKSVAYDYTSGATIDYAGKTLTYKDSTTGETKTQTYSAQLSLPIKHGKYIDIGTNYDNNALEVKVDDTALALDYWKIQKTPENTTPIWVAATGAPDYASVTKDPAPGSFAYRDANGNCSFHKINLSQEGLKVGSNNFDETEMAYGLKVDLDISDQTGGTLTNAQVYVINTVLTCRIRIQDKIYNRVSKLGRIPAIFMSCDNTGTIYTLTCDTNAKTYTVTSQAISTYKHVTQMHVVIPGDDNYYLTIFTTDKHGAMYNSGSASTLLDNIGTAGTMAYKQNTANAAYIPVYVKKTSSGNWEWNMGSASGIFTTAQIDTITDDYETIG